MSGLNSQPDEFTQDSSTAFPGAKNGATRAECVIPVPLVPVVRDYVPGTRDRMACLLVWIYSDAPLEAGPPRRGRMDTPARRRDLSTESALTSNFSASRPDDQPAS